MANFEVDFPDDLMKALLETDSEEIITEALEEAAPILERNMKSILRRDQHELSGELIASIKSRKPKRAKNGAWIVNVIPTGYSSTNVASNGSRSGRKYKISNALKAIWIEYGIAGQQPARPFLTRVINESLKATLEKLQEVYERKVK